MWHFQTLHFDPVVFLLWQNNTNAQPPLFFDYFDESSTDELAITFRKCDFVDNAYAGLPSQPALVVGNSQQNRISIIECNFERNDMVTNNPIVSLDFSVLGELLIMRLTYFNCAG